MHMTEINLEQWREGGVEVVVVVVLQEDVN